MIGLIGNQLMVIEPILSTSEDGFEVRASKKQIYVYPKGTSQFLQTGVTFFLMSGKAELNPRTGEYRCITPTATIRAVFAGRHKDIEVRK